MWLIDEVIGTYEKISHDEKAISSPPRGSSPWKSRRRYAAMRASYARTPRLKPAPNLLATRRQSSLTPYASRSVHHGAPLGCASL